jgi:hypothetical protein
MEAIRLTQKSPFTGLKEMVKEKEEYNHNGQKHLILMFAMN